MTEAAPDIPPWSPLADPARRPGGEGPDGADPGDQPAPRRRSGPAALVAGALALLLLVLVVLVVSPGGSAPSTTTPAPGPTVRDPLPTSSIEQPVPLDARVALGNGWTASVQGADLNATARLTPANRAAPIEDDERYVLIDLELAYVDGPVRTESPFHGVDLGVVGESGEVVTTADASCRVPAAALDVDDELARGQTVRGRICFAVPADQMSSLVLVAEPSMAIGSTPSYLALREPAP